MESEPLQKLKEVASIFNADNAGNIFFGNELVLQAQDYHEKEKLSGYLTSFIYSNCYCRNNTDVVFASEAKTSDDAGFVNEIAAANTGADTASEKWQVMFRMPNGDPIVNKGTDAFLIRQDEIMDNPASPDINGKAYVSINNRRAYTTNAKPFYYIFSNNPEGKKSSSLLRFYWNIEPSGVPLLINRLTSGLNRHYIPFQFKCLKHPAQYNRHDGCVLYIFPRYLHMVCAIIRQFMDEVVTFLKEDVPMFTLKLVNGLSFAESPDGGQSFGMQHAGILAQTLVTAFENRLDEKQKLNHITETYQSLGYDLTCLYKNPGSTNDYSFLKQHIN